MKTWWILGMLAWATIGVAHAADVVPAQRIALHRRPNAPVDALVSVGIPLPPAALTDASKMRIVDGHGDEIPAAVQVTLRWYARDASIRAVRAQFHATAGLAEAYFVIGSPRTRDLRGWAYDDGLVDGGQGVRVPAVTASLTSAWLCSSLVAGPQWPAAANEPYAAYVAAQFAWARALPVKDPTAWLFDRPSTLFKAYVRTGNADYLASAEESYRFYMARIRRDGLAMSPFCAGGWTGGDKPCDVKYVYLEPILLAAALSGDDTQHDAGLIDKMMTLWDNGGWNNAPGPYSKPSTYFTERLAGLGLIETVAGYELTGDAGYRKRIDARVGWLYDHQQHNPDGLGNDGSWRNSWALHENDSYDAATDVRGASTWMTENIIDGLWHAWLVTGDARVPTMIEGYGRYLEAHGWIPNAMLVNPHDWRNPCSGPNGQIAWYWSSPQATVPVLSKIQDSEGWYSDAHTVELGLPVAAAYYFERDPARSAALKHRFEAIASSYSTSCAAISDTLRRFNWNNRGSGVAQWLIRQPAGGGLAVAAGRQP
jgi:hypothetical protein